MINVYETMRNEYGDLINGRTKLFIVDSDTDGTIIESLDGIACVPEGNGTMFIVDDWLIPQVDKLAFVNGELKVKDGETIDEPAKTQKQLMMEELERQMAELAAMPDEVLEGSAELEEEEEEATEEPTE